MLTQAQLHELSDIRRKCPDVVVTGQSADPFDAQAGTVEAWVTFPKIVLLIDRDGKHVGTRPYGAGPPPANRLNGEAEQLWMDSDEDDTTLWS